MMPCPTSSTFSYSRWSRWWRAACCSSGAAALALLGGCGNLPQPFAGHPGVMGARLAQPPPARLAVPVPTNALLTDSAAADYEQAVAAALQVETVPAVADIARKGDWQLTMTAEVQADKVVPTFTVQDPQGRAKGSISAPPVDAAQWAEGNSAMLQQTATHNAPMIASLLTQIEATRRQSAPNSLVNRAPRVQVPDVTGAPGDGNRQLARNLRLQLPQLGETVQEVPDGADYVVQGEVKTAPGSGGSERIEIQWVVRDAQGREAGRLVQLNEVTPGSLDSHWGDVAMAVAQEAAGGVQRVIENQIGVRATATAAAAAAQPATPPPAAVKPAPVKPVTANPLSVPPGLTDPAAYK